MATLEIQVPNNLSDITLSQYLDFEALPSDLSEYALQNEMITIFTDLSRTQVMALKMSERHNIVSLLKSAIGRTDQDLVHKGTLEGVEIGFVPNLDNISIGEFIDIEKYQSDSKQWANLMRVLYRPIVEKQRPDRYSVMSYQETLDLELDYSQITMDLVFGSLVFFCDLGSDLVNSILKSLNPTAKQQKSNTTLVSNGDGTESLSTYLIATLGALREYRKSLYIKL